MNPTPHVHEDRITANLQENSTLFFDQETDPTRQFQMADHWLREYEKRNTDWPGLARMCKEVDRRELWKLGGYHSWAAWVQDAAPVCARTVHYAVRLYDNLTADFSDEELKDMPVETAKVMTQVSTERRKDPEIRKASKKKKKDFVQTVRDVAPEQHIEAGECRKFTFTESQWERIQETLDAWRVMNNPETSDEDVFEALCSEWMNAPWDASEDALYSNEQRAKQLMAMKES